MEITEEEAQICIAFAKRKFAKIEGGPIQFKPLVYCGLGVTRQDLLDEYGANLSHYQIIREPTLPPMMIAEITDKRAGN